VICGQCNKLGHSKEHCHSNSNNPNNKLKDKKEVAMNGVSAQIDGGTRNKSNNKGGRIEGNKSRSIIYRCFICNSIEHKIYNCFHKDTTQAKFKEKAIAIAPKKEDVVVNMVLIITTHNQIPKNVVFEEKKPLKNKSLANWQEEEKFQCLFEEIIKHMQHEKLSKDMFRASIQTLVKANLTKNFGLDIKATILANFTSFTKSTGSIKFTVSTRSTKNIGITKTIGSFSVFEDITP
jgi:hypothetical protein